ncbi:MAG: hypothetical protein IKI50_03815 [Clostridia bacterium]|nr:hypothetical protein [Clostridia bacterium]
MEKLFCSMCEEEITEDTGCNELDDGTVVCDDCYDCLSTCDGCGALVDQDDLTNWGDCRLCPDCMEDKYPHYDEETESQALKEVYEQTRECYIGRKTNGLKPGSHTLSYDVSTDETDYTYSLTIAIDENGTIADISRLTGSVLLSESITSSVWKQCSVYEDDYKDIVASILEDVLLLEDAE